MNIKIIGKLVGRRQVAVLVTQSRPGWVGVRGLDWSGKLRHTARRVAQVVGRGHNQLGLPPSLAGAEPSHCSLSASSVQLSSSASARR